ncbi:hypothetical protein [Streptomyces sp. NPDC051636]
MREPELIVNRFAQGLTPLEEGVTWFSAPKPTVTPAVLITMEPFPERP